MGAHRPSQRRSTAVALALLGFGIVLSACGSSSPSAAPTTTTTSSPQANGSTTTTTTASGTISSEVSQLGSLASSGASATFQATYTYTDGASHQTMVFAQSPPKSLFKDSQSGLAVDTGTATYFCSAGSCYNAGTTNPLAELFYLFDGKTFQDTVSEYAVTSAYLAAHGDSLTFSTSTYAGQASKCVTITQSTGSAKTAVWCVADRGIMTSWRAGSASFSLTSFTASPPSADFALPAGAKIVSLP
jgi:hypothetical protein